MSPTTLTQQLSHANETLRDGWTPANATWTYASASTITVPSGAASKYAKGDKIKLTQTTVKYFYVVGVADTVLTITGGSDYTLVNATISLNYYSHASSPIGFPGWMNWTPAITYSGGTTDPTSNTVNTAKFHINSTHIEFLIKSTVVEGGGDRTFTLYAVPFTISSGAHRQTMYASMSTSRTGGNCYESGGQIIANTTMDNDGEIQLKYSSQF